MLESIKYKASPKEKLIIWIWGITGILTEAHSFFRKMFPTISQQKANLWISGLVCPIEVQWYIKFLFDNLVPITIFYTVGLLSYGKYPKIYYASFVWLSYYLCDLLLFGWNFKMDTKIYWPLLLCVIFSILTILFRKHKMKIVFKK